LLGVADEQAMATTQQSAADVRANTGIAVARERPAIAAAALGRLRRPTRSSLEFAAKAAVATAIAIWLGNRIGLHDSYWAGVSAVVATAGTLGASLGAAVSRISATLVGLAIGLAAFALPVSGVLAAGATIFVALTVLPALSLDAGARLGAGSTLIVTALPGHGAISDALARGANTSRSDARSRSRLAWCCCRTARLSTYALGSRMTSSAPAS
jgi:uncharacterized membrane protein YccC